MLPRIQIKSKFRLLLFGGNYFLYLFLLLLLLLLLLSSNPLKTLGRTQAFV